MKRYLHLIYNVTVNQLILNIQVHFASMSSMPPQRHTRSTIARAFFDSRNILDSTNVICPIILKNICRLPAITKNRSDKHYRFEGIRCSMISDHQLQPAGIALSSKLYIGWCTIAVSPLPTKIYAPGLSSRK